MNDLISFAPDRRSAAARLRGVTTAAALLALVATALVDRIAPAAKPRLVGHESSEYAKAQVSKRLRDGSLARWVEREVATISRVRQTLGPWWSAAMLSLEEPIKENLVMGRDGWLFLRRRAVFTPEQVRSAPAAAANTLLALRRRFARHGSELYFVPIPRKAAACSAQLPVGMDGHAGVEAEVVRRLRAGGAPTLDLLAAFEPLAPPDTYMRLDTHWELGAQRAAARALAARFSELHGALDPVDLAYKQSRGPAALLRFAGLQDGHPAFERWNDAPLQLAHLASSGLRDQLTGPDKWSQAWGGTAIAGTSFTAHLPFHALAVQALQAPVVNLAFDGAEFAEPFVEILGRWDQEQPLPKRLLVELPVFQVFDVERRLPRIARAVGATVQGLGLGGVETTTFPIPVVDHRTKRGHPTERAPTTPQLRASLPDGSALSSGDGAIQLRIDVKCDAPSKWSVRVGSMDLPLSFEAGQHVAWVPILEGVDWLGGVRVFSLDAGAHRAQLSLRPVVVSAEPDEPSEFPTFATRVRAGHLMTGLAAAVRPGDVLFQTWGWGEKTQPAGLIAVQLMGTGASGEPASASWSFPSAVGTSLALSLGPFEGGQLESVNVGGPRGTLRTRLLRARPSE